jgi:hypothetical protein
VTFWSALTFFFFVRKIKKRSFPVFIIAPFCAHYFVSRSKTPKNRAQLKACFPSSTCFHRLPHEDALLAITRSSCQPDKVEKVEQFGLPFVRVIIFFYHVVNI